jgi:hypothetical protein
MGAREISLAHRGLKQRTKMTFGLWCILFRLFVWQLLWSPALRFISERHIDSALSSKPWLFEDFLTLFMPDRFKNMRMHFMKMKMPICAPGYKLKVTIINAIINVAT